MPAPAAASSLVGGIRHAHHRGWCCIVVLWGWGLVWMRHGEALLFPLDVDFGLRDQYAVEDLACLPRRPVGRVGVWWRRADRRCRCRRVSTRAIRPVIVLGRLVRSPVCPAVRIAAGVGVGPARRVGGPLLALLGSAGARGPRGDGRRHVSPPVRVCGVQVGGVYRRGQMRMHRRGNGGAGGHWRVGTARGVLG